MSDVTIPGGRIRSFVERIENIDSELAELNEQKKEVFSEAKGEGFDVKILQGDHQAAKAGPGRARRARKPARSLHAGDGNRAAGEDGKGSEGGLSRSEECSPDERSDIRGGVRVVPDRASLHPDYLPR